MAPERTAEGDVFVRPFGYDDGLPVVEQIGDRDLFLGNARAADQEGADFDHVLSLTADAYSATTHHRPLADGDENEWTAFERAVDTARELTRREWSLLVHCNHGISRSTAVIATVLAAEELSRSARRSIACRTRALTPSPIHTSTNRRSSIWRVDQDGLDTSDGRDATTAEKNS